MLTKNGTTSQILNQRSPTAMRNPPTQSPMFNDIPSMKSILYTLNYQTYAKD